MSSLVSPAPAPGTIINPRLLTHSQTLAGQFLAYCRARGLAYLYWRQGWWEWTGTHYRLFDDDLFEPIVDRYLRAVYTASAGGSGPDISRKLMGNVISRIRSLCTQDSRIDTPFLTTAQAPKSEGHHVTFSDGRVLNVDALLAGEPEPLKPCDPRWFSTVALPFTYNPTAQCPTWDRFLAEIFEGDQERIDFITEWIGYCTIFDYEYRHQKAVILAGEGKNGKSQLVAVVRGLLGTNNISSVSLEDFGQPFGLEPAIGKLLNVAPEVVSIDRAGEAKLKAITGGDYLTVNRKYLKALNLKLTARLMFQTNEIPTILDRSGGMRRRLVIVPFDWQVPEAQRILNFAEHFLLPELPGIFNRAMAGLQRLTARGDFLIPKRCQDVTDAHMMTSNPARTFLEDQCERDRTVCCSSTIMYQAYVSWFIDEGYPRALLLAQPLFAREVERHYGVKSERRGGRQDRARYYTGLRCNAGNALGAHTTA